MEDDGKMKKWETEIGDFWNNIEDYYPVQPYQPVKVSKPGISYEEIHIV